jgi:hypothetical protein
MVRGPPRSAGRSPSRRRTVAGSRRWRCSSTTTRGRLIISAGYGAGDDWALRRWRLDGSPGQLAARLHRQPADPTTLQPATHAVVFDVATAPWVHGFSAQYPGSQPSPSGWRTSRGNNSRSLRGASSRARWPFRSHWRPCTSGSPLRPAPRLSRPLGMSIGAATQRELHPLQAGQDRHTARPSSAPSQRRSGEALVPRATS